MTKRKHDPNDLGCTGAANSPRRKSARLQQKHCPQHREEPVRRDSQLPSPSRSYTPGQQTSRKQEIPKENASEHHIAKKTRIAGGNTPKESETLEDLQRNQVVQGTDCSFGKDPSVLRWLGIEHLYTKHGESGRMMSQQNPNKRKNSSSHHSEWVERLSQKGVHMEGSALLHQSSQDLCYSLLEGDRTPSRYPCYPQEKVSEVLQRIHTLNEFRLQRDITPWVVPSPENLFLSGESKIDWIGEEVQADWTRCATIGGKRPRPDFALGLQRKAFLKEEFAKLQNYSSPERPFSFTPNLYFPFLICEVKTGQQGMELADGRNIHSASIAVRAIIRLAEAAYGKNDDRVKELHGKVLVFTVSHNNRVVNLYGHFAVASEVVEDGLEFYRYDLGIYSLTMFWGRDRNKPYNFVRNVCEKFAPDHLKRIQEAVACLPALGGRTGLSFAASDLLLDESSAPDASLQAGSGFQVPGEPASAAQRRELTQLKEQMLQQKKESKDQIDKLLQQLEQQRQDNKEQMERQKQDSKEQMELVREQHKVQVDQLKQMMSMLERNNRNNISAGAIGE